MADKKQQKKNDVNPYSGKFVPKKKDPLRPFLPVLGLLIIAAAGAVAWFGSPFLINWLVTQQNFLTIPAAVTDPENALTIQALAAMLIFFIIVAFASLLYAVVAPRPPKLVQENVLLAERKQAELERQRDVARKRKMKARMKNANKEMDDI